MLAFGVALVIVTETLRVYDPAGGLITGAAVCGSLPNSPNTSTSFCAPTNTFPFVTTGTTNFTAGPNWSRPLVRLEPYSKVETLPALYARRMAGPFVE